MAFDRMNFLKKIVTIQSIVLENKRKGRTQKWIYENLIRDQFYISFSCYNRYLGMNAKGMMKKEAIKVSATGD